MSLSKEEIALAKIGLDALIDEATGYQVERFKDNKALKERYRKHLLESDVYCWKLVAHVQGGFISMEVHSPNDIRFFQRSMNYRKDGIPVCSHRLWFCPFCGKRLREEQP